MRTTSKIIVAWLVWMLSPQVGAGDTLTREIDAKNISSVQIKTFGEIKVFGWDKSKIKVNYSSNMLEIEVSAGAVYINDELSGGQNLHVWVPKKIKVDVRSISGEAEVRDLQNRIRISTVSGDVRMSNCTKAATLSTVDGDLALENVTGNLELQTVSGDLKGRVVKAGTLEAKTVSGDLRLNQVKAEHVKLTTHSGDVEFSGSIPASGDLWVKSFSGDMQIYLPSKANFEISASTQSGDVKVKYASLEASIRSDNRLVGRVGQGGPDLTLASFSGDILVTHLQPSK